MSSASRIVLIGIMASVFTLGNLFIPLFFWEVARPNDFFQYMAIFFSGALVAQVALLGIWAGLGPGSVISRVPVSTALLVLFLCAFLTGLQIPDWLEGRKSSFPFEAALFMATAAVFGFVCAQTPLWLLRAIKMWRIDLPGGRALSLEEERAQFGLGRLMIWMAVISVLMVVIKFAMPNVDFTSGAPWAQLVAIMFVFTLFGASVTLPCLFITMAERGQGIALAALMLSTLGGPFLVFFAMTGIFGGGPNTAEIVGTIFCFGIGAAATTLIALGLMRMVDYRLVSPQVGEHDDFGEPILGEKSSPTTGSPFAPPAASPFDDSPPSSEPQSQDEPRSDWEASKDFDPF